MRWGGVGDRGAYRCWVRCAVQEWHRASRAAAWLQDATAGLHALPRTIRRGWQPLPAAARLPTHRERSAAAAAGSGSRASARGGSTQPQELLSGASPQQQPGPVGCPLRVAPVPRQQALCRQAEGLWKVGKEPKGLQGGRAGSQAGQRSVLLEAGVVGFAALRHACNLGGQPGRRGGGGAEAGSPATAVSLPWWRARECSSMDVAASMDRPGCSNVSCAGFCESKRLNPACVVSSCNIAAYQNTQERDVETEWGKGSPQAFAQSLFDGGTKGAGSAGKRCSTPEATLCTCMATWCVAVARVPSRVAEVVMLHSGAGLRMDGAVFWARCGDVRAQCWAPGGNRQA